MGLDEEYDLNYKERQDLLYLMRYPLSKDLKLLVYDEKDTVVIDALDPNLNIKYIANSKVGVIPF